MAKILWDQAGDKKYETGVDHGVLYVKQDTSVAVPLGDNKTSVGTKYHGGVAWNGLTSVSKSPSGAEANDIYADNVKYASLRSAETFGGTIEAYTYPDAFAECDGSKSIASTGVYVGQQARRTFGMCYRTAVGNDIENNDYGYKLHVIYGALAAPSEKAYATINDSPEAITFSWEFTTTPVEATGFKPTSHIEIDSTVVDASKLEALEAKLYGSEDSEPTLPMPNEIIALVGTQG